MQCNSGKIFHWLQLLIHNSGTQNHDNGGRLKLTNGFRGFPLSLSRSAQFNLSELTALFDSLDRHVHDQMSVSVSTLTWREWRVTTKTLQDLPVSGQRFWHRDVTEDTLHGCLRSFVACYAIKPFGITDWFTSTLLNVSCWY